jgi:hypothetical protein
MIPKAITYEECSTSFKKGLRNGNWRKLRFLDKALFRAAMGYAKRGRSIVNEMLVEKLLALIEKLKETKGMRIFRRGLKKAVEMLEKGEENGVFVWAPSLKKWLKDRDYVFWLGTVR